MKMNIFVGNLPFSAGEGDVKKLFEGFGNVVGAVIVMRKEKKTPKSRGFAFVDMPDERQALAAIAALNGKEFMGRVLDVNPARPKTEARAENGLKEKRQPGGYKGGRRTYSYRKRHGIAGVQEEVKPRPRVQDNPMRWRKKKDQAKSWQKRQGDHKPWKKTEGGARPWKKAEGESKPRRKSEGAVKPWSKSNGHPQKPRFNPFK